MNQHNRASKRTTSFPNADNFYEFVTADEVWAALQKGGYRPEDGRRSGGFRALCPFQACAEHSQSTDVKHRSLWVGDGYHCHRCGENGHFGTLAGVLGIVRRRTADNAIRFSNADDESGARAALKRRLGPSAMEVIEAREITLHHRKPRGGRPGWSLAIPAGTRTKYKQIVSGFGWPGWDKSEGKGPAPHFIGLGPNLKLGEDGVLTITEGEMDWLSCCAADIAAVTVTKGAGARGHAADLAATLREIPGLDTIRIIPDHDPTGMRGAWNLATALKGQGLKVDLRGWRQEKRGHDLNDAWIALGHDPARLRDAISKLRVIGLPNEVPPEGLYIPEPKGTADYWFEAPHGYMLTPYRVVKPSYDGDDVSWETVCEAPIWIEKIHTGLEDGDVSWTVACIYDGGVVRQTISRGAALDSSRSGLPQLAACGFPIPTQGASAISRYLQAAEKHNLWHGLIGRGRTAWRNGWLADPGKRPHAFVVGTTMITARQDEILELDPERASDHQWSTRLRPSGEGSEWAKALAQVADHPRALVAVVASAASPLYELLDMHDTPILDWWGESSKGKSTALRLALSLWGDPSADLPSWNSTRFAIEAQAALSRHLPVILDETTTWSHGDASLRSTLLDLSHGSGKSAGQKNMGLRARHRWRAITLCSGNYPLLRQAKVNDTAMLARVFELGPTTPFPPGSKDLVVGIEKRIRKHHGHAGPALIRRLLSMPEPELTALREEIADIESRLEMLVGDLTDASGRRSQWWAPLYLAGRLLAEAYPSALAYSDVEYALDEIWITVTQEVQETPIEFQALEQVLDYLAGHEGEVGPNPGARETVALRHNGGFWIRSAWLRDKLESWDYAARPILDRWMEHGWIEPFNGSPTKKNHRFGGTTTSAIHLLPTAQHALGDDEKTVVTPTPIESIRDSDVA